MTAESDNRKYDEAIRHAADDPEGFWNKAAKAIDWFVEPTMTYNASEG